MKFALINGQRTEPQPKLKGICINCQNETIAKCGKVKIWHWAHKSKISCDPWWENETEWHRKWKNLFPIEWQEKIHIDDSTNERHIADVKTDKDFVIEFQHSSIQEREMQSREAFYKNMVWVVDGTRLKRDYPRFCEGIKNRRPSHVAGFSFLHFPEECFPKSWMKSSVPIYFDFHGVGETNLKDTMQEFIWCLCPGHIEGSALVFAVLRNQFVELALHSPDLLQVRDAFKNISLYVQQQRMAEQRAREQAILQNIMNRAMYRRRGRRF